MAPIKQCGNGVRSGAQFPPAVTHGLGISISSRSSVVSPRGSFVYAEAKRAPVRGVSLGPQHPASQARLATGYLEDSQVAVRSD